ncbi:MAG: GNAT family N-acetyltransferase [Chromatiaceae bacterium]|nr:MAG: GNAT family N-acetyltransferase [Chromatiaceae bacterium]
MPSITHARSPTGVLKTLPDGRRYRLRPPRAGDQARVADCFERLSERSRRLRFFVAKQALTGQELDFFTLTDGQDHIAVAALALDQAGREDRLLGMARCLRLPHTPQTAELALAVADEAQGSGLGQALIAQVMAAAADQGIRRLVLETALENRAMQTLAQRCGGVGRHLGDGLLQYEIPVAAPATAPIASTDRTEFWPWLGSSRLLEAWYRDWIAVADSAFLLGRDLNDGLWAALREAL